MSIEPFKYVIQAVALERDDATGRVLKEVPAQPVTVYTADQAVQSISEFEEEIAKLAAGDPGVAVSPEQMGNGMPPQPLGIQR